MAPGLLDMPEDVMNKIMENIGIKTIMALRKVCHDLRNFIDDVKPDANLEEIKVSGWDSHTNMSFRAGVFHSIDYEKHQEGCWIMSKRGFGKLLNNEDFVTIFMKDFEILLGHQKSALKQFTINGPFYDDMNVIVLENIQRILKSRVHPLKVEKFTAEFMDQNQLMSILPFLDSITLNTLEIRNFGDNMKVDELVKLEQWTNIKQIKIESALDLDYIQHFAHFSTDYIFFRANQFPDLVLLKDRFLQSPGIKSIEVLPTDYDFDEDSHQSMRLLGEPFSDIYAHNFEKRWYYSVANQILEIIVSRNCYAITIKLSRIYKNSVPQNAVIQN